MEFVNTGILLLNCVANTTYLRPHSKTEKTSSCRDVGRPLLNKRDKTKSHAKEVENLKHVISEIIVANDGLKKTL